MEISDKENFMAFHSNSFEPQEFPKILRPLLDFQPTQSRTKPPKNTNANLREGDWVCLVCNNLNFSFRDECNRCQVQTKMQNLLQGLHLTLENQSSSSNERLPFRDLTNQKQPPTSFNPQSLGYTIPPSQKDHKLSYNSSKMEQASEIFEAEDRKDFDFFSNYGFGNALLLTPPRILKQMENYEEFTNTSEKEYPVYKSPKQLPSVSPILKRLSLNGIDKENRAACLHSKVKLTFSEKEQGKQDEKSLKTERMLSYNNEVFDENFGGEKDFDLSLIGFLNEDKNNVNKSSKELKNLQRVSVVNSFDVEDYQKRGKVMKQDWVCSNCNNLNYSFRKVCNRCQLLR